MILRTGKITQNERLINDTNIPRLVPKNFLKTAPVYPSKAEMSSFSKINILDKSMGFTTDPIKESFSSGYS